MAHVHCVNIRINLGIFFMKRFNKQCPYYFENTNRERIILFGEIIISFFLKIVTLGTGMLLIKYFNCINRKCRSMFLLLFNYWAKLKELKMQYFFHKNINMTFKMKNIFIKILFVFN